MSEKQYVLWLTTIWSEQNELECSKFERIIYTEHTLTKDTELELPNKIIVRPERIIGKIDIRIPTLRVILTTRFFSKNVYTAFCNLLQKDGWYKFDD